MRISMDCVPCFVGQALDAVRLVADSQEKEVALLRQVLAELAKIDLNRTPPEMGQQIHRLVRQVAGGDPYIEMKRFCNELAAKALPEAERLVAQAADPFEMAVRFAMAGNNIDAGVRKAVDEDLLHEAVVAASHAELDHGAVEAFRRAVADAREILYLGDNCGEIYFDKLLLRQMPLEKVTYVVRGGPIINDATQADAEAAGITEMVPVIDNGSDVPGTCLSDCSEAFLRRFHGADLIVAKGQGNFETLSEAPHAIYFLLRAKCPVIAKHIGCPIGTFIIQRATNAPR